MIFGDALGLEIVVDDSDDGVEVVGALQALSAIVEEMSKAVVVIMRGVFVMVTKIIQMRIICINKIVTYQKAHLKRWALVSFGRAKEAR